MRSQICTETALASALTVGGLFSEQVRLCGRNVALEEKDRCWSYFELNDRVNRLTHVMLSLKVARGDRIAVLSENRHEYVELYLAAAKLGAIIACQNWRQSATELSHCVGLSGTKLAFVSERHLATWRMVDHDVRQTIVLGEEYERALCVAQLAELPSLVDSEDGLIIVYTSGTTGLPKGALISHRAMVARSMIAWVDGALYPDRSFIAWSPLFHMAATDFTFGQLINGGKVVLMDGFDAEALVRALAREQIGVLTLLPGVIDRVLAELERTGTCPVGIKAVGSLADLVPREKIAAITSRLGAPYRNTFGSSETGLAPACRGLIPPGVVPERLSKTKSSYCQIRLVDEDDNDVADGEPGEVLMRGPSLFSGYWEAPEANSQAFRGGWYHMGDVLVRNQDGTFDFVDRRKYLIKSGGENIYPAEIERILLDSGKFSEAVVIRQPDRQWGEVPVAVVAIKDGAMTAEDVIRICRGKIANYKLPKAVKFLAEINFPRSTTGKVKRHELEALLGKDIPPP